MMTDLSTLESTVSRAHRSQLVVINSMTNSTTSNMCHTGLGLSHCVKASYSEEDYPPSTFRGTCVYLTHVSVVDTAFF